jgi:hypothetical protein
VVTYWGVCWWGWVPYPCKKHRTEIQWHYHFSYLIVSKRYLYTNYDGCEYNLRYRWTSWNFPGVGSDEIQYEVDKYFTSKKSDSGPCVGVPGGGTIG